jgi:choice-of-anchor B domain-containing protein
MKTRYITLLTLFVLGVALGPAQAQSMRSGAPPAQLPAFGGSLAVGGDEVLVGSARSGSAAGEIYRYTRSADGAWVESARLRASDGMAGDNFGRAMALHGALLVVGATGHANTTGAGYVFERDTQGNWAERGRLMPEDAVEGMAFGRAMGVAGDFVLMAAAGRNKQTGAVYVFRNQGGAWKQHSMFSAAETVEGDLFGLSLAADGEWAVVGSPVREKGTGAVYLFKYDPATDAWTEHTELQVDGLEENAQFGAALMLTQGYLFVGAPGVKGFTGAVYMFHYDSESGIWQPMPTLVPFDSMSRLGFGAAFGANENQVLVGAQGANNFGGIVYVLSGDSQSQVWTGASKLRGSTTESGHGFGSFVAVNGNVAAVGSPGADGGEGIATIFERRADTGVWEEKNIVYTEIVGMDAITGAKVDCSDGKAQSFQCQKVDLLSFLPVQEMSGKRGTHLNDIWGWTDPTTGKEYALVGRNNGTSFVDVSNPNQPLYVGDLPKTNTSPASTWRDIKVYKDHAYVVADNAAEHGMQVFDLRQLRDVKPADMPVTFEPTARYTNIHSAHNVVINEETGFAYTVGNSSGGETCGGGLHMIDIREPAQPTFAGCFSDPTTGRASTGYSHDAQCVVYRGPDTEYQGKEICLGSNETALSIADVSDKKNPKAISRASYPNVGYSHQGWLTEDQRHFLMNDELDESAGSVPTTRTLIWDVQDLDDPQLIKEFQHSVQAIDHNLYIKGNLVYESNYLSGLRILDITDVENPIEWGHFDTTPTEDGNNFGGSWSNYPYFKSGIVVLTSMYEGLFVIKARDLDI